MTDETHLQGLTGLLRELAEAIGGESGRTAALALARHYGGGQLLVPGQHRLTETSALARAIGLPAARVLAEIRPRESVEVPLGPERGQAGRRRRIAELIATTSLSDQAVARRLDVSRKTVQRVRARMNWRDPRQPSLLD